LYKGGCSQGSWDAAVSCRRAVGSGTVWVAGAQGCGGVWQRVRGSGDLVVLYGRLLSGRLSGCVCDLNTRRTRWFITKGAGEFKVLNGPGDGPTSLMAAILVHTEYQCHSEIVTVAHHAPTHRKTLCLSYEPEVPVKVAIDRVSTLWISPPATTMYHARRVAEFFSPNDPFGVYRFSTRGPNTRLSGNLT